jgi:hypothetical protein
MHNFQIIENVNPTVMQRALRRKFYWSVYEDTFSTHRPVVEGWASSKDDAHSKACAAADRSVRGYVYRYDGRAHLA